MEAITRFSAADTVLHQLLFQRTIPGFEPSPESYAVAEEFLAISQTRLVAAGVTEPGDVDLFTAVVSGLTHQQVANDPGGDRWVRLSRRAVDMYLAEVTRQRRAAAAAVATSRTSRTRQPTTRTSSSRKRPT